MKKICRNCAFYKEDNSKTYPYCNCGHLIGTGNCSSFITLDEHWKAINDSAPKENDMVNHPNHYNRNGLECMTVIRAALGDEKYEGFLTGNILKYIYRYPDKNGIEDCKKARFYLNELIELLDK